MTYQQRPWSAVDAIINAGRDMAPNASDMLQSPAGERIASLGCEGGTSHEAVVLSRLLAITSACPKPCIQFTTCSDETDASGVACAITRVAAAILGRSLLLDTRIDAACKAEESLRSEPVPDAFVPGLFHYRLAQGALGMDVLFGQKRRSALMQIIAPFQFVAVNTNAPYLSPASAALVPMCTGTVLIVQAGATTHAAIKEAALHIARAGGKIIGLILDQALADSRRFRRL